RAGGKDAAFLDYQTIPSWAVGYVNVASTIAKTSRGKAVIVGYPANVFKAMKPLRRDEAALITQRLIDKETTRTVKVSGQLMPGTTVSINGHAVQPNEDGDFSFEISQNTSEPMTVA